MWRIRNFIKGIKNLIFFFPVVWGYHWWDYTYSLAIFKRSLEQYPKNYSKHGLEVKYARKPKIKQMERVIELLEIEVNDSYISEVEKEMGFDFLANVGEEKHREMFDRIVELEHNNWNEIWNIIKGEGKNPLDKSLQKLSIDDDEEASPMDYFDNGTDMRGWWD